MNNNLQPIFQHGRWNLHEHHVNSYRYTDGIFYLMQIANCDWLIDAIFSHQRTEPFQVWEINVSQENKSAVLTMKRDTNEPYLVEQEIPETDFPLPYFKLWMMGNILLLIQEYE